MADETLMRDSALKLPAKVSSGAEEMIYLNSHQRTWTGCRVRR